MLIILIILLFFLQFNYTIPSACRKFRMLEYLRWSITRTFWSSIHFHFPCHAPNYSRSPGYVNRPVACTRIPVKCARTRIVLRWVTPLGSWGITFQTSDFPSESIRAFYRTILTLIKILVAHHFQTPTITSKESKSL